jgi:proline iminopeptidase
MIVSNKGAELFCTTRGHGPVCIVLTAIGTPPYERQTQALSNHLQLVYVDLRGSGRSTGVATDLTFDLLADDLDAVRVALGVERISVLGHSALGVLALEYARRCPTTVAYAITVGTPPFGDMGRLLAEATSFFAKDASPERQQLLRDNMSQLAAGTSPEQMMIAQTPMRFYDARYDAAPLFADADNNPQLIHHLLGTLLRSWDVTVGADSLRVPIFLGHGRHDYVSPCLLWDGIPAKLPRATFHLFEQSGHQPFVEEPEQFVAAVTNWMRSL